MTLRSFLQVTGAPTVPDLSFVKDLPPGVAYATLATITIVTLLIYFGPSLRAHTAPKPDPPKADPPTGATPIPASSLPQAMDSATQAYERFIDHLLREASKDAEEREQIERERDQARREATDLRTEVQRLNQMLWQRGPS